MEITKENIEKTLNAELVGKDVGYSNFNFTRVLLKVIRAFAKEAGLNESDFSYNVVKNGSSSATLTYKGMSFGGASFQKQKGKYSHGGYEWTFKKCSVDLWCDDAYSPYFGAGFVGMIQKMEDSLQASADLEAKKLALAKDVFQIVKQAIGAKDDYDVVRFIDYMSKNKYSLCQ